MQCTSTQTLTELKPNSVGRQKLWYQFTLPKSIPFDNAGLNGFSKLRVKVTTGVTAGVTYIAGQCFVDSPPGLFGTTCSLLTGDLIYEFTAQALYTLKQNEVVQFHQYVTSSATITSSTNNVYTMDIILANYDSANTIYKVFGVDFLTATPAPLKVANCTG